jgi:hypothetical protein
MAAVHALNIQTCRLEIEADIIRKVLQIGEYCGELMDFTG